MRTRTPQASPESRDIEDHLRSHAAEYFEISPESGADVRLVRCSSRRISRLYHFSVRAGADEHQVLVKMPSTEEPSPGNDFAEPGTKPRRSPWAGPARRFLLEHDALSAIDMHFSRLDDARFGSVRVLDVLRHKRAVIMERVDDPSLRDVLLRSSLLRRSPVKLEATFHNSGAWLREFHSLPGDEHVEPRHTRREDLVRFVTRLTRFLSESLGEDAFFGQTRDTVTRIAADALPDSPPVGLGHGDFAPRNILVAPDGRVTVLDTLGRFRTPIYEDIGYFLVNLKCGWPELPVRRVILRPKAIAACEDAFLAGYFGNNPPFEAIRLYEVQAMLDRWAAAVSRSRAAVGPLPKFVSSARRAMLARFFRREISDRLLGDDGAGAAARSGGRSSRGPEGRHAPRGGP